MLRQRNDAKICSITQRKELSPRRKPYFVALHSVRQAHLGYRKMRKNTPKTAGGKWLLRYRWEGRYKERAFAQCDDDGLPSNGNTIQSFEQAVKSATVLYSTLTAAESLNGERQFTVGDCMSAYLSSLESEGKPIDDALWRINTHIDPYLKDFLCAELDAETLRHWRDDLAKQPPRVRSSIACKRPTYRKVDMSDPEVIRKRQATVNRTLTVLRAALNLAFENDLIDSDMAWRKVCGFKGVDASRSRCLKPDEINRLLNACPPDFGELVRGALLSGCRYGELRNAVVNDFDRSNGILTVPNSKSGNVRRVILTETGASFLANISAGRRGTEQLFRRADGNPWGPGHQNRRMQAACAKGKIAPPTTFHGLRHTYASKLIECGGPNDDRGRKPGASRYTNVRAALQSPSASL